MKRKKKNNITFDDLKIASLIATVSLLGVLSATYGAQIIYILVGAGAVGGFLLFPNQIREHFEDYQHILLGTAFGFLFGCMTGVAGLGVLGSALGAWAGYFINSKITHGINQIKEVKKAADPILHPMNFINETCKSALNTLNHFLTEETQSTLEPTEINLNSTDPNLVFSEVTQIGEPTAIESEITAEDQETLNRLLKVN